MTDRFVAEADPSILPPNVYNYRVLDTSDGSYVTTLLLDAQAMAVAAAMNALDTSPDANGPDDPAYPAQIGADSYPGLTVRETFYLEGMKAMMSRPDFKVQDDVDYITGCAVTIADAMLVRIGLDD